jgi:TonB family protein
MAAGSRILVSCLVASGLALASGDTPSGPPSDSGAAPPVPTNDITPPEKTSDVHPSYPPEAKEAGREGRVVLKIIVKKDGSVQYVKTLKSMPEFDSAAIEAVRQWKYKPAMKDGEPVAVYVTVTVNFKLRGK